MIRLFQNPIIN